jgi:hypothetical protein
MQGEMLRLPAHRRAAGADFFRGAEEGAAGERVVAVVERGPVVVGMSLAEPCRMISMGSASLPRCRREICPRTTRRSGVAA